MVSELRKASAREDIGENLLQDGLGSSRFDVGVMDDLSRQGEKVHRIQGAVVILYLDGEKSSREFDALFTALYGLSLFYIYKRGSD
jgi:hypothetical protein